RAIVESAYINIFRLAAFVPFPVMKFESELLKGHTGSVRFEADPGCRFERDQFGNAALRRNRVNAKVIMRRVALAAEEDFAIRCPADRLVRGWMIGESDRFAP